MKTSIRESQSHKIHLSAKGEGEDFAFQVCSASQPLHEPTVREFVQKIVQGK
jgi:hypothetical protein